MLHQTSFEKNQYVTNVSAAGKDYLAYLLFEENECRLVLENLKASEAAPKSQRWLLKDAQGNAVLPLSLHHSNANVLTFTYYPEEEGALARCGCISFSSSDNRLSADSLYLQQGDVSGGLYYPILVGNVMYYCAKKFSHNELRYIPAKEIGFEESRLIQEENETNERSEVTSDVMSQASLFSAEEKRLGDFSL